MGSAVELELGSPDDASPPRRLDDEAWRAALAEAATAAGEEAGQVVVRVRASTLGAVGGRLRGEPLLLPGVDGGSPPQ